MAIALVRAGPAHNAVMIASVVGNARPAETPPTIRARNSTSKFPANPATIDARNGQRHAGDQQHLAAVSVSQGPQVEHRSGQAQRVADRDQVQLRLTGVESPPDIGQSDIRDREIEVRDRSDQDERPQDEGGSNPVKRT